MIKVYNIFGLLVHMKIEILKLIWLLLPCRSYTKNSFETYGNSWTYIISFKESPTGKYIIHHYPFTICIYTI